MKKYKILALLSAFMPLLASAQDLQNLFLSFGILLDIVIPVVVALALLYFFWGLAQFILKAGGDTGIEEGKKKMVWGIIALFVMLSIWGFVSLLSFTIFGSDTGSFVAPTINSLIPR